MSEDDTATDANEFWERRRDLDPVPTADSDDTDAERHLVLLADLSDGAVVDAFEGLLDDLGAFDCLAPVPPTYLHVTVTVFGNVVDDPAGENEFSRRDERDLAAALDGALAGADPVSVSFARFNLFPTVVYAEVRDGGQFGTVNDCVCAIPDVPVWERDRDYLAHLTLGQFTRQAEYDELVDYLERNRELDVPATTVEELELVALDRTEGRYPAFETVERYPLA